MKARFWPAVTMLSGAATLVLLVMFSFLPDVRAGYPGGDFGAALSQFQRATTMADLEALFGAPADPVKLAAMTAGNRLDLYAFIPAYGLFLVAAAAMLAGGARRALAWLAILPVPVAMAADALETWAQLRMTTEWARAQELLPALAPACWTKYFALAAHGLGVTAISFIGERKRWILGALGFTPLPGVFADWAGAVHIPTLMTVVFGVFWLALLSTAVMETVRAKGASP